MFMGFYVLFPKRPTYVDLGVSLGAFSIKNLQFQNGNAPVEIII